MFVALKQGAITFGSKELRMVLAVAALALPVVNILTNREQYNWVRPHPLQPLPPLYIAVAPLAAEPSHRRRSPQTSSSACEMHGTHA